MKNRIVHQSMLAAAVIFMLAACGPSASGIVEGPASSTRQLGIALDWPEAASSIMQQGGSIPLLNHSKQRPAPIASTAKVITALTILAKHPLGAAEEGPTIVMDAADVARYEDYRQVNGSVLPVHEGMRLSEREALAAMLLPSANNIADSMAVWAFGSMDQYRTAAQQLVASLKLDSTTVGLDASGLDPSTVSTVHDLALLASAAMDSPVIASLVARSSFDVQGYGPIQNTNTLIGTDGVIGLKTGTSNQAGGVFLFAAKTTIQGQQVSLVGAVQGAGERAQDAIEQARQMLESVRDEPSPGLPGMLKTKLPAQQRRLPVQK